MSVGLALASFSRISSARCVGPQRVLRSPGPPQLIADVVVARGQIDLECGDRRVGLGEFLARSRMRRVCNRSASSECPVLPCRTPIRKWDDARTATTGCVRARRCPLAPRSQIASSHDAKAPAVSPVASSRLLIASRLLATSATVSASVPGCVCQRPPPHQRLAMHGQCLGLGSDLVGQVTQFVVRPAQGRRDARSVCPRQQFIQFAVKIGRFA